MAEPQPASGAAQSCDCRGRGSVGGHAPSCPLAPDATEARNEHFRAAVAIPADPDRACLHPDFAVFADVGRIVAEGQPETDETPAIAFRASIRVECAACGERFRWIGVEAGDMPSRPMVSVDEFELRAPIRPASSDPDFGLGMPGFAVRYREGS